VKQLKIVEISAKELAERIKSKEISSEEVIKAYFERIEEAEEKVDAFITLTKEDALKSAKKTDEKISRGEKLGAIEGIPVAIKDNIVTKGIKTTCASKILENFIPPYNATVVDKIKNEGGIIIGKTNMDEFAMGSSTENSRFKNTKNPYDLSRVPGGSSGGSAAAVASLEAPLALGSETGGSVRQPASFCGVVGIKPTYGLVSRYGLIAFASSLDQIGTLGRNVEDCAFMLNVISGYDDKDSTSVNMVKKDYMKYLSEDIKGMKIALPKEYFGEGVDKNISERIRESARAFEKLGATIEEVSLPYTQYALPCYYLIATSEASSNLARFDGIRYGYRAKDYSDINELYINTRSQGFGEEVKRRIMLGTYSLSSGYYDAYYKKA
jgi:aspartyl-tRNA(Asn)/glutamyl-tRNA(Gln) amidotransferase subunit A